MAFNETWTAYPLPNITGLYDTITYANTVTSDMFSSGLVLTIFAILFMVFKRYGDEVAFGAASFITFTLSSILWGIGLVDEKLLIMMAIMAGASVILMWRRH